MVARSGRHRQGRAARALETPTAKSASSGSGSRPRHGEPGACRRGRCGCAAGKGPLGMNTERSLAGKVLFITGASRGIGLAIALRAARDGAAVAVIGKTDEPHPKLEGTVHSAVV